MKRGVGPVADRHADLAHRRRQHRLADRRVRPRRREQSRPSSRADRVADQSLQNGERLAPERDACRASTAVRRARRDERARTRSRASSAWRSTWPPPYAAAGLSQISELPQDSRRSPRTTSARGERRSDHDRDRHPHRRARRRTERPAGLPHCTAVLARCWHTVGAPADEAEERAAIALPCGGLGHRARRGRGAA